MLSLLLFLLPLSYRSGVPKVERVELHKWEILVNKRIISLCRCASIWTNILSELGRISNCISNRILLDNFNFKIMLLVKKNAKLSINQYFFIIYLAVLLIFLYFSLCSSIWLTSIKRESKIGEAEITDVLWRRLKSKLNL